jgi:hypothetical protein
MTPLGDVGIRAVGGGFRSTRRRVARSVGQLDSVLLERPRVPQKMSHYVDSQHTPFSKSSSSEYARFWLMEESDRVSRPEKVWDNF